MSLRRFLTASVAGMALVAASFGPFAASASADSWNGGGPRHGYHTYDYGRWTGGPRHRHAYRYHHKRDKTGKIIALGIGALILGILASQAGHEGHVNDGYYD